MFQLKQHCLHSRLSIDLPGKRKKTIARQQRIKSGEPSKLISACQVPSEFSRRTRALNDGLKAEEYRNIGLFFFPTILGSYKNKGVKKTVALFAYLMRLYYSPDEDFYKTSESHREEIRLRFMRSFIRTFGEDTCTYYFHHVAHLDRIRQIGPLTELSAIPFESMFSVLRRSFCAGTMNIPKQILEAMYLRLAKGHSCTKRTTVSEHVTAKVDDSLLYVTSETADLRYQFYKVSKREDNDVTVQELIVTETNFGLEGIVDLPWRRVGAFQALCYSGTSVVMPLTAFEGKAVMVKTSRTQYIFSVSLPILQET